MEGVTFSVSISFGTTGVVVFGSVVLPTTVGVTQREVPERVLIFVVEIGIVGTSVVVLGVNVRAEALGTIEMNARAMKRRIYIII